MHWIDGTPAPDLAPDRGLEFGDGLFETIAVVDGRLRLVDRHLARLAHGAGVLGIALPPVAVLRAELEAAARTDGTGVVKLIVTRGAGGQGYAPATAAPSRRHVLARPARQRPAAWSTDGVAVRLCELRLAEQPRLAGLKHLNRLEQVLARAEWQDPDIAEGLMLDAHGRLVGGTMSNVFVVVGGRLVTPALDRAGIRGVMRSALLDAFAEAGEVVVARDLWPEELATASEVFLSNALIGVWPVRRLGELAWPVGAAARRAAAWIRTW